MKHVLKFHTATLPLFLRHTGLTCLLLGTMSGCLATPQVETLIHESPQGRVTLKTFTDSSIHAAHPITTDAKHLQVLLRGLRVQEQKELLATLVSGEGEKISVFSEHQLEFLTPLLADALTHATSEEYIEFDLITPNQLGTKLTSGVLYVSRNFLRIGLQKFQADSRQSRMSSKASFPPTRRQRWELELFPETADKKTHRDLDPFPIHVPIGSVSIALYATQHLNQPQKVYREKKTKPPLRIQTQDKNTQEMEDLKDEIGELQQQLEGQTQKLRKLEKRLEQAEPMND